MRVVDDDRFLVPFVHLPPDPELLGGVELVERRRARGVGHRDEPLRAVAARPAGDHAARLVRVVGAGVGHDLVAQLAGDRQHDASVPAGSEASRVRLRLAPGPGTPAPRRARRRPRTRPTAGRPGRAGAHCCSKSSVTQADAEGEPDVVQGLSQACGLVAGQLDPAARVGQRVQHLLGGLLLAAAQRLTRCTGGTPRPPPGRRGSRRAAAGPAPGRPAAWRVAQWSVPSAGRPASASRASRRRGRPSRPGRTGCARPRSVGGDQLDDLADQAAQQGRLGGGEPGARAAAPRSAGRVPSRRRAWPR